MIHWEQSEDKFGFATWLRYVECSHWGLIFTGEMPRWYFPVGRITGPVS